MHLKKSFPYVVRRGLLLAIQFILVGPSVATLVDLLNYLRMSLFFPSYDPCIGVNIIKIGVR